MSSMLRGLQNFVHLRAATYHTGDNKYTCCTVHAGGMETLVRYKTFVTEHAVIACFDLGCVELGVGALLCYMLGAYHGENVSSTGS